MNDANRIGILLFLYSRRELTIDHEKELLEWRSLSPENEQLFKEISDPEFVRRVMSDFYNEREEVFDKLKPKFSFLADTNWYDTNETINGPVLNNPDEEMQRNSPEKDISELGNSKMEFWNTLLEKGKISGEKVLSNSDAADHLDGPVRNKKKKPGRMIRILKRTAISIAAIILIAITLNSILGDNDEPERFQVSMGLPGKPEFKLDEFHRGYLEGWADISYGKTEKGERLRIFSEIKKAPKDAMYYIVTYKRNESILKLPDGTILWMYPNSSIHFPAHYSSDTIHLEVKGKIYFEFSSTKHLIITKDTSMQEYGDDKGLQPIPNDIVIEPSKAACDITARSQDSTVTVNMLSGSMLVSLKNQPEAQPILLEAGKQITVGQTMHLQGQSSDSLNILSLKNGEIYFKDASLKEVMDIIPQWYDVTEVRYEDGVNRDQKISLHVPLGSRLSDIFFELKKQGISVVEDGKMIWVSK